MRRSGIFTLFLMIIITWPVPSDAAQSASDITRHVSGDRTGIIIAGQTSRIGQIGIGHVANRQLQDPSGDQLRAVTKGPSGITFPPPSGILSNTVSIVQPGFSTSTTRVEQPGGPSSLIVNTQMNPVFPGNRFGTTTLTTLTITQPGAMVGITLTNPSGTITGTTTILQPGFASQTIRIGQLGQSTFLIPTQIGNVFPTNPVGTFTGTILTPPPLVTTFNSLDITLNNPVGTVGGGTFITPPPLVTTFNSLDITLNNPVGTVGSGTFMIPPPLVTTFNSLDITSGSQTGITTGIMTGIPLGGER
ncbi:MAG TPA: hypothetical protein VNM22_06055 [Candidatus Limnocylindrales bacterium]|nr:hypothetical protein [Candidatus Limnocylindrales bacterium]